MSIDRGTDKEDVVYYTRDGILPSHKKGNATCSNMAAAKSEVRKTKTSIR